MRFPVFIARRYLFSKSSQNAINIINMVALIVVVVATAALFVVLAGFSGLKTFGLSFSNAFNPDLKVEPVSGKYFQVSEDQLTILSETKEIASFSKVVQERVLLNYKKKVDIVYLKGVDSSYVRVVPIEDAIPYGAWLDRGKNQVITGYGIANRLSLGILEYGDLLEIIVPKPGKGSITNSQKPFKNALVATSGVYAISEEIDNNFVLSDISLAQRLLNVASDEVSHLEIKVAPNTDIEALSASLESLFEGNVLVKDRQQQNEAIYKMLNTENIAIYLIFTLVLIIALFNVVGSIIMMILDKKKNVRTLHSLGASIGDIRKIFFNLGLLLTAIGGGIGVFIGLLVVGAQKMFNLAMITPSLPYPVEITLPNVLVVLLTILILGTIASKIASSRITKQLVA